MRGFWSVLIAGAILVSITTAPSQTAFSGQEFTVQLENFRTRAQLTYPSDHKGPFATVLLLHAGYPSDMDASFLENGAVISRNFLGIAEFLSSRGFAVARYDKRFVTGATSVDQSRYDRLRLEDFVADARRVLQVLRKNPLVDTSRIVALGWSEGALVGTRLALEGKLRGLVLIGPPVAIQGRDTGLLGWARQLRIPVLILQGANDSITPAEQAGQLEKALGSNESTLVQYAGLGHGLGPVGAPLNSQFAAIAAKPLEDLSAWLKRTAANGP